MTAYQWEKAFSMGDVSSSFWDSSEDQHQVISFFLILQMLPMRLPLKVTCFMWYFCGLIVSITHRLTSDPVDRQKEGDVDLKLPGEISQSGFKFTSHLCHGLSPWIAVGILLKGNLQGAPRCSCFLGSVDDPQSPEAPIFHTVPWSA